MYYSVLIEYNDQNTRRKSPPKPITIVDMENIDDISKEVIIPYLKGENFNADGFVLNKSQITRIKIVQSTKSIKALRDYKQSQLSAYIIATYSYADIINNDELVENITNDIFNKFSKQLTAHTSHQTTTSLKTSLRNMHEVFIVHGHDEVVKINVARFLEKLGLTPIILHEQASKGKTIIEKIENYSNVGYGIVLYTPCDKGGLASCENNELRPRARQNVVFEHGYLIGKLGRDKVCALIKDDVEYPNDISGILYIKYQDTDGWKFELAKELKNAGYDIDLNKLC